jgi:Zn-dependent peptidase ImmA (M78 family)/transcriptional regulator with XRE-family HTH domain
MPNTDQDLRIGLRLKSLREERGISQEAFAAALGIEHRQTITAIESGARRITPTEMVRAAAHLGVDIDALTDPFRLVGEGSFSFRAKEVAPEIVATFEEQAGRWIATYRELSERLGAQRSFLGRKLEISARSSFEDAMASGEALWESWELGDVPADGLEDAVERHLGILVLYVDAAEGISGAASHLPKYDAILVNRKESTGRRYFDLAHELFHILTWDAMPPRRVEGWDVSRAKGNRVENLADNFAGALLMPSAIMQPRWEARGDEEIGSWLARTATELRVSADAVKWRLVAMKLLSAAVASGLTPRPSRVRAAAKEPLLFSGRFVELVSRGVDAGLLSVRRAAGLLGLRVGELARLCAAHGYPLEYNLTE